MEQSGSGLSDNSHEHGAKLSANICLLVEYENDVAEVLLRIIKIIIDLLILRWYHFYGYAICPIIISQRGYLL